MTLKEKLTSLQEVLLFLHIAKENKVTKIAKLQTLHKVLNLTVGSLLGSLCQKISGQKTDKKNNTQSPHILPGRLLISYY